ACEVRNLLKHSKVFRRQKWQRFRDKDGEKGPIVWEVKHTPCYIPSKRELPSTRHTLIVARNVINLNEVKYFISDRLVDAGDISLKWMMWVAFARWPIEECFKRAKNELGMDHFEVRNYTSLKRHLLVTAVSHLFLVKVHQKWRGEKSTPDGLPTPPGGRGSGAFPVVDRSGSHELVAEGSGDHYPDPASQREGAAQSCESPQATLA
ncbi:MAG: hypothetical protein QGD91_12660, partial [Actinomycetota bacterium]|nr:hypothetical protein [Actinomycetota bacterium]